MEDRLSIPDRLGALLRLSYLDPERSLARMFGPSGTHILFCDMDGVLADFEGAYKAIHGTVPPMGKPLDPDTVGKASFWADMGWAPGGEALWSFIRPLSPTLLTANPGYVGDSATEAAVKVPCEAGKREWVDRHISPNQRMVVERDKPSLIVPGKTCVLIDDMAHNLGPWNAAGGIAILHVAAKQTISKLIGLVELPEPTGSVRSVC
jgi:hypothetical protein